LRNVNGAGAIAESVHGDEINGLQGSRGRGDSKQGGGAKRGIGGTTEQNSANVEKRKRKGARQDSQY